LHPVANLGVCFAILDDAGRMVTHVAPHRLRNRLPNGNRTRAGGTE
jgi:hypothetical protein